MTPNAAESSEEGNSDSDDGDDDDGSTGFNQNPSQEPVLIEHSEVVSQIHPSELLEQTYHTARVESEVGRLEFGDFVSEHISNQAGSQAEDIHEVVWVDEYSSDGIHALQPTVDSSSRTMFQGNMVQEYLLHPVVLPAINHPSFSAEATYS